MADESDPDETLPMTHRPYGSPSQDNPYTSPSGPSAEPSGPTYEQPVYAPPSTGKPPYGSPPHGYQPMPGYAPPMPYGYGITQNHSGATTSMVLGIISLASALLTPFCFITAPGILTGPFAIWTGLRARKQIDAEPRTYGNRGAAVAGLITGIIGTAIGLALIAAAVLLFLVFASVATPDNY